MSQRARALVAAVAPHDELIPLTVPKARRLLLLLGYACGPARAHQSHSKRDSNVFKCGCRGS
ncbi:MAG TPA: hypothetical protein VFN11_00755 [Ktedonobacterales bacterium]|nr:hypothetical protein [Ktedonobacterales bacterium]